MKKQPAQKWIWRIARKEWLTILLLTFTGAAISFSYVVFALISQKVVDVATGALEGNMWHYSGMLIAVLLLQAVIGICNHVLQTRAIGRMEIRIKEKVFKSLYRKKWQSISRFSSGDILNRLTSDVHVAADTVASMLPRVVSLLTRLIAALVVLIMMDKVFAVVLLAAGGLLLLVGRLYGVFIKKIHAACQQSDGEARFFMQESLENWSVVQAFHASPFTFRRLGELLRINYRHKMRRSRIGSLTSTAMYLLFSGCYYVALAWGAWRLAAGVITFGTLTAFLQIVQQVQTPFRGMSGILPQYYSMLSSTERLIELEELDDELPALPAESMPSFDSIEIRDLCFSYDRDTVFDNASVVIQNGEFVALAGHSGIGKSTLLKLLLGFLDAESGELVCRTEKGSMPINASTRGYFSYVPQGNLLLSGTIRQNITFGCDNVTEEQIWKAAELAAIDDFIRSLPQGLDTLLGERGLGLSDGQLQRLAIARGILYDTPILLLDEATSALDEETERRVLTNLRRLTDKTLICISHRAAALQVCDRVLYIRDGRFEEEQNEEE